MNSKVGSEPQTFPDGSELRLFLLSFFFAMLCFSPAPKQDEPYFLSPGLRKMMFDIVKGKKNSFPEGV